MPGDLPQPHLEKLRALLANEKLPERDRQKATKTLELYNDWLTQLKNATIPEPEIVGRLVSLLEQYKRFVEVELIFDSEDDFLYRQKGQLKLDNSIIEEFIPHLVKRSLPKHLPEDLELGARNCFSAIYFMADVSQPIRGAGLQVRTKDQDFALSRRLFIRTSHSETFGEDTVAEAETHVAYVTAEIKTNLDKTMFQEASATAHDVKMGVTGARYYLLCEWLDMTPINTTTTDIDEVLILRKAKRLSSTVRSAFATATGRKAARESYLRYLDEHPFSVDVFQRFLHHLRGLLEKKEPGESDALNQGFF
jgi:hypothetical protein